MFQKGKIRDARIERRKHRRSNCVAMISHEILTDDGIHTGKMYNFSRGGLYFESDQIIYKGDEILIKVLMLSDDPDSYEQFPIDVEIIWQRALKESVYKYGYGGKYVLENEFIEDGIHEPELERHGLPDNQIEKGKDPRHHPRRLLNQSLLIRYKGQIHTGSLRNMSSGGAFIETNGNFLLGAVVQLSVSESKAKKKSGLKGRVVRLSPGGFAVRFARASAPTGRKDSYRRDIPKPENKNRIDHRNKSTPGYSNEMPFEF